ncbi:hypothetical protein P5W99_10900 [Paraburkholderia sp. A3BS-1L]|uniref:hypothetical protein n=1 Tax=Paraburkholderia sp. A3BS-1L TaxID=3028375 RepID=UPI003DA7F500
MGNSVTAAQNLNKVNGPRALDYRKRIETALSALKKRGVTIPRFGKLVAEIERETGINRTNLTRNDTYKTLILMHYIRQKGGIDALDEEGAPVEVLLSKVRQLKAELLAAHRKILEMRSEVSLKINTASDSQTAMRPSAEDTYNYQDFANLGKLILELVERSDETFEIDFNAGTFIDRAAAPGKQKFGGETQSKKFMKWAVGHKAYLLTVQQLTKLANQESGRRNP